MRHAKRTDANQADILDAMRKRGICVYNLSESGKGVTDLVSHHRGKTCFIEIKMPGGVLKKTQIRFLALWTGFCGIATTEQEAIDLATLPTHYGLTEKQKDALAVYYSTMTVKEVQLNTILKVIAAD